MIGGLISLLCDDCGMVSTTLLNCWCRSVVCPGCRIARHTTHKEKKHDNQERPAIQGGG